MIIYLTASPVLIVNFSSRYVNSVEAWALSYRED
jgi:hypothetical protein